MAALGTLIIKLFTAHTKRKIRQCLEFSLPEAVVSRDDVKKGKFLTLFRCLKNFASLNYFNLPSYAEILISFVISRPRGGKGARVIREISYSHLREDSRGSSIRQTTFYLNLVTDNKKRREVKKGETHTVVGQAKISRVCMPTANTYLCASTDEAEASGVLLLTFYLVIIEFNDLANEQNSDSHHNKSRRGKVNFHDESKRKIRSIAHGKHN